MFCPNCGEQIPDSAKFCPQCSGEIRRPENIKIHTRSNFPVSKNTSMGLGIANVALAIIAVLPWIDVNFAYYSGSFSLWDICLQALDTSSALNSAFGSLSSDAQSLLYTICFVSIIACLTMLCWNIVDAVNNFKSQELKINGFISAILSSAVVILAIYGLNSYISDSTGYFGSYLSSIISTSIWPWVAGIAAVVCLVIAKRPVDTN